MAELTNDYMSQLNVSETSAQILLGRDFSIDRAKKLLFDISVRSFLDSSLRQETLRGHKILKEAKKVGVFCDYDADGILSSEVIQIYLKALEIPYTLYIPERADGYGLQLDGVRKLISRGVDVMLTADCGSNDIDAIKLAKKAGLKVIITDHHKFKERPPADAFLNSMETEFASLCGCAVVGFFLRELDENLFNEIKPYMAVATIGDLVPLYQESRQLVADFLNFPEVPGVLEAAFQNIEDISTSSIGFQVIPKFNAFSRTGKIAEYLKARNLVPSQLATIMQEINQNRKQFQKQIVKDAEKNVNTDLPVIVVNIKEADDSYIGYFGLVASRLTDKFKKPSLVGYINKDGLFKGSGRSVSWINLHQLLSHVPENVLDNFHFGGHSVALGFEVGSDPNKFNEIINNTFEDVQALVESEKTNTFDLQLKSRFLYTLEESFYELQPFGSQFPHIRVKITDLNIESFGNSYGYFAEVARGRAMLLVPPLQQKQLLFLQRKPKIVYADLISHQKNRLHYVIHSVHSDHLPEDEAQLPRTSYTQNYATRKNLGVRRL